MKLFKDKPIELHCYTTRADVYNYAPIKQGAETSRPWFKAIPTNKKSRAITGEHITAKTCPAIVNDLKTGIILPLWSDVRIQVAPICPVEDHWWKYQYADGLSKAANHTFNQLGMGEIDKEATILQLISPWKFRCSHDIPFMYTGDQLELIKHGKLEIVQGVIDFRYQASAAVSILVRKKETEIDVVLPYLTPLLKLIPLTEKKIKVVNHLVSEKEYYNLAKLNTKVSFNSSYYKCKAALGKNGSFKFKAEE
tara:strand:- start:160 stop:915 length:756 start_codon:yes stop_codon:yes gene_type:complete